MEYRVLGSVEVAGVPAASLGGRREQALLAALVLNVGAVVSTDRLIDALWGDRPPRSAAKVLQNCVLRLRKAGGASPRDTPAPGYRLVASAGAVDAHRFEELVRLARTAAVNGAPARAADALEGALALWRGTPFEELAGWDPAEFESERLTELRRVATEQLMDADLACGRHAARVADLEAMVAAEPMRERRWAMLMLALYRCGRQAEALRTYQRARATLAEQLGIEPGPELRALERAVIAQDESLDSPPPVETPAAASVTTTDAGIIFILFSDIARSTELLDRLGDDAMEDLRQAHFQLLRDAVRGHGGREVKSIGDGLMVVFTSAVDAVACAIEIQRTVAAQNTDSAHPLGVRVGLHVGEPARDEDDFFGMPVVVARRLCDAAEPGQILASDLVRELVESRRRFAFANLGPVTVKGLEEPVVAVEILASETDALSAERPSPVEPPYKGLVAFEPEDRDVFFGREEVVTALITRLATERLLAVVGASGSGKSSVVRAGVLGETAPGGRLGIATGPAILMTPGAHPLAELAARLSLASGVAGGSLHRDLRSDPAALDLACRQLVPASGAGGRVLLVVDQFEEVFTLCRDEAERRAFIDALVDAVTVERGVATVVLALRGDFYGHCGAYGALASLIESGTALLGPMHPDEVRLAIEGPAKLGGLRLEHGLAELIVRDVEEEPGALPLLSHALLETWKRRRRRTLTLEGYREAGGVEGAIARTAEAVYGALDAAQQMLARDLFVRLTDLGEGTEYTRRRVPQSELVEDSDASEPMSALLETLTEARLVTVSGAGVEVAHEALIREWPRLRGWLDDDRDSLRLHRHLTHAAQDWVALERDAAELYRGPRLVAAREVLADGDRVKLNSLEAEFLRASIDAENDERRAVEEQAAARERANRRLRVLLLGTASALVVALAAGVLALRQRDRANDQADRAQAASVSAEVDRIGAEIPTLLDSERELAALLAVEAERLRPNPATRGALLDALTDEPRLRFTLHGGRVGYFAAAQFPGNERIAAMSDDGVDIWDLDARELTGSFDVDDARALAVSPDGELIATGHADGTVTFRDTERFERTGAQVTFEAAVADVAFSPDGRTLAVALGVRGGDDAATAANAARLVDVATRVTTFALSGHGATVNAVAFSPDGQYVATGGNDGIVVLHDAASGAIRGDPLALDRAVQQLAFSPDSRFLAAFNLVSGTGTVSSGSGATAAAVLDVATGAVTPVSGIDSTTGGGFNPDGSRLLVGDAFSIQLYSTTDFAAVGDPIDTQHGPGGGTFLPTAGLVLAGPDGTVSAWDTESAGSVTQTVPESSPLGGVFSPDGALLAMTGNDGAVVLYRTDHLRALGALSGAESGPVAFSPNGDLLAVGDGDGRVQLFDVGTRTPLGAAIRVSTKPIFALRFSPDGRTLAAAANLEAANGAFVIDVASRTATALEPPVVRTWSAAFSADGTRLVMTSAFGGGVEYPISEGGVGTGTTPEGLGPDAIATAFSPDGTLLAVGTQTGTLVILDATTLAPLGQPIVVSGRPIAFAEFSPDGQFVVTQDLGVPLSIRLVDMRARAPVEHAFPAYGVGGVSFAPDTRTMVLPGPGGSILLDLDVSHWRSSACERAGRTLTEGEWQRYLSSTAYEPTCRANRP
jgi:class 3 adenylate cyclase/WD40 repeat protein